MPESEGSSGSVSGSEPAADPGPGRNLPVPVRAGARESGDGFFSKWLRTILGWRASSTRADLKEVLEDSSAGDLGFSLRTAIIESQDGRANRVNLSTLERQVVSPLPPDRLPKGERERWNWNTPIVMSSFDPKTLYMGSHVVFKSADRGVTWKAISPDVTGNIDRETLQMMGARVPERALSRHDGQTSFSTSSVVANSSN